MGVALRPLQLRDGHMVRVGRLPASLELGTAAFDALWDRRPDAFHQVRTPAGRLVPTPRWQQAYDRDYVYTGSCNNALPLEELTKGIPALAAIVDWTKAAIDARLNGVLVNWYDGMLGHYIGRHRDSRHGLVSGAPIAMVSFGEARTLRFRPHGGRGQHVDFTVEDGSVVVVPYDTNLAWTHEVTASKRARGRRVSVTLRAFE